MMQPDHSTRPDGRNIFLINAHQPYPFSKGELNRTLADRARRHFESQGDTVRETAMQDTIDVDGEVEHHVWADLVFLQMPVNWMGVPWTFKRYMDLVYTAGMDGRMCHGDGRTRRDPTRQYGLGGALTDVHYALSLTLNAPEMAFNDPTQRFFAGMSVDQLLAPMHLNFKFFGMQPLETFACHDVMKNPKIADDLARFDGYLTRLSAATERSMRMHATAGAAE
ncbi:MAG: NAD(P)H-dependent oxidoreductase [Acidobacteriota bacterium]